MNSTSSVVTGGVTVTAATIVPLINWALNGFPHPIPDTVPYLIAAALVTLGHLAVNLYSECLDNRKNKSQEPTKDSQ